MGTVSMLVMVLKERRDSKCSINWKGENMRIKMGKQSNNKKSR